jgi:hypothetical protein
MISDETREKLQNIIRGELQQGESDSCTAIRNLLCESFGADPTVKSEFASRAIVKEKQVDFLKSHAKKEGLLLHNILFPDTAYSLLGFIEIDQKLFAMIQQLFVEGDQAALEHIEEFLKFNGFSRTRRQDYYNSELRLTLEDMHDENVIARGDVLFFIDTVFYIIAP